MDKDNIRIKAGYTPGSDQRAITIYEDHPLDDIPWAKIWEDGTIDRYQDALVTPIYVYELIFVLQKHFALFYKSLNP